MTVKEEARDAVAFVLAIVMIALVFCALGGMSWSW